MESNKRSLKSPGMINRIQTEKRILWELSSVVLRFKPYTSSIWIDSNSHKGNCDKDLPNVLLKNKPKNS